MRSSIPIRGLTALLPVACGVLLALASARAAAGVAPSSAANAPVASATTAHVSGTGSRAIATAPETGNTDRFRLARAAHERRMGTPRAVIENLEAIDFTAEPTFADADRAAFLLGQTYLEVGDVTRFANLARHVARWRRTSVYTRWIAFRLRMLEIDGLEVPRLAARPDSSTGPKPADTKRAISTADSAMRASRTAAAAGIADSMRVAADSMVSAGAADSTATAAVADSAREAAATRDLDAAGGAAADALAAHLLLRDGDAAAALRLIDALEKHGERSPLALHAKALALAASGRDDDDVLAELAAADTTTRLGRDLAGAAIIRRATEALGRGQDPRPLLETVPVQSRYVSRARHMLGLASLERGDAARGRAVLEALLVSDSGYVDARAVRLALAGAALDGGDWEAAHSRYQEIDGDWTQRHAELQTLMEEPDLSALWRAWSSQGSDAVQPLDEPPARLLAERLAAAAIDLGERPSDPEPVLLAPADTLDGAVTVPPPATEAWQRHARSELAMDRVAADHERARWEAAQERERLAASRLYLEGGADRVWIEKDALEARSAQLDSLRATLAAVDRQLQDLRDVATRHLVARATALVDACQKQLLWLHGMRRLHLEGESRGPLAPPDSPTSDSLITAEEALAAEVAAEAQRVIAEWPGLIARSYDEAWKPRLIDRAGALAGEAKRSLAWAGALQASIESTYAASSTSETLRRRDALVWTLAMTADSARAAHAELENALAHEAVQTALSGLAPEREAIDYGLAVSAYAMAVRLERGAPSDSAKNGLAANGAREDDDRDDPETARRRDEAIASLRAFLERHPASVARGETRFRLADLMLIDARRDFRERMDRYVASGQHANEPVPVLDHGPALVLYQQILDQDGDFAHRDAVLFNAGMILADGGDPQAGRYFEQLIEQHPNSGYVQEASLRLGDLRFAERDYQGCVMAYSRAVYGADAGLTAIALYKTGWAHFNEDRFVPAADAFGSVLDLYASDRRAGIQADIESEARTYLVNSLAGAGGASAFTTFFETRPGRAYERTVLLALGQHFRRFGQYADAVACDELFLERYPKDASALLAATRMTETYQRWDRPAKAREVQESLAPRFAPSAPWFTSQSSDSARAAGNAFARDSWKAVAFHHHREAREKGSDEDWKKALSVYQTMIATWPDDPERAAIERDAGEASAHLGQYPEALAHYRAAESGPDSIASQARWQRVAVTDAWYESTRPIDRGARRGAGAVPLAANATARTGLGNDSLAHAVLTAVDELLAREPHQPKRADLSWRAGHLALAHGWLDRAALDFGRLADQDRSDSRAPFAAGLRADALFQSKRYEEAGAAYEKTRDAAHAAGIDTLERHAIAALPICAFKNAEAAVAADSSDHARHARLFEQVAARWPGYEQAHVAQYRAGLAYQAAGEPRAAITAMETLLEKFPKSPYATDAELQVATTWRAIGDKPRAAEAYARFAERHPDDAGAREAWLLAADLFSEANLGKRAEELRLAYIRRYPDDFATAMEILEAMARGELAAVTPEHPISKLIGAPAATTPAKRGAKPVARPQAAPASRLADYLALAQKHPTLASKSLLAQVRFLEGEESYPPYAAARLKLPLKASIAAKQKLMDTSLARYRKAIDLGYSEWARAAAYRIGEALVQFGDALMRSDRPADLTGDNLMAYEDVLMDRSQAFYDRAERVWSDLLRETARKAPDDPWIARAQTSLWGRLATRFYFKPEAEYPLVEASRPEKHSEALKPSHETPANGDAPALAGQKEDGR